MILGEKTIKNFTKESTAANRFTLTKLPGPKFGTVKVRKHSAIFSKISSLKMLCKDNFLNDTFVSQIVQNEVKVSNYAETALRR